MKNEPNYKTNQQTKKTKRKLNIYTFESNNKDYFQRRLFKENDA